MYVAVAFVIDFIFRAIEQVTGEPAEAAASRERWTAPQAAAHPGARRARRRRQRADDAVSRMPADGRKPHCITKAGEAVAVNRIALASSRSSHALALPLGDREEPATTARRRRTSRRRPRRRPEADQRGHADRRHEPPVQAADVPRRARQAGRLRRRAAEALATTIGVKLKIENLDFNGLIPGLQSKKFDMVSVGLTATPERKKVDRLHPRVRPVRAGPGRPEGDKAPARRRRAAGTSPARRSPSLQGSTARELAKETFPKAEVRRFPDQNAAFLEVATGPRRRGRRRELPARAVPEVEPRQAREGRAQQAAATSSTARGRCRRATARSSTYLNKCLCKMQNNGTLAAIYKKNFEGDEIPPMPEC